MNNLFNQERIVTVPSKKDLEKAFEFSPHSNNEELWFKVKRKMDFFGSDIFFEVKFIVSNTIDNRNLINQYRK